MHAQDFQEPNEDIIWTKHKANHEGTPRCDTTNVIQIISKNQINTWFSKVQHTNYIKAHKHEEKQKHPCSKNYLIQEGKTITKEWDNQLPKRRERFRQRNQTLHTFMMAQSTKKKISFKDICKTRIKWFVCYKHKGSVLRDIGKLPHD